MEKYNTFKISVEIIITDEEVNLFKEYREKAAAKGLDVSLEALLSSLLEADGVPHQKRQAAFYIDGKII